MFLIVIVVEVVVLSYTISDVVLLFGESFFQFVVLKEELIGTKPHSDSLLYQGIIMMR